MAIEVRGASFSFPDGTVGVENVSFKVPTGKITALIGPNGAGKTTMLELIAGDLDLDEGAIRSDTEVAYMRQDPGFDDLEAVTVLDALALSLPEELKVVHRRLQTLYGAGDEIDGVAIASELELWQSLGGYESEGQWDQVTRAVLRQGMVQASDRKLAELSGGERKSIIVRSFLLSSVPTLILDEPDNFLDLFSKAWLGSQLRSTSKTIMLVSHDRKLLSEAVDRIVILEHNSVWTHGGTYATYPEVRQKRLEILAKDLDAWNAEERRLFRIFKTHKQRAKISEVMARKADVAEARWQRFKDVGPPPMPPPIREITPRFKGSRSGTEAIRLTRFEVEGLVAPFSLKIYNEERVVLLGENGVGKSTFLKMLIDDDVVDGNTVRFGPTARIGYFSQDNVIDTSGRALLEVVGDHFGNEQDARSALGRYGLASHTRHRLKELSGGQKARVQLLLLETTSPNVLLLDEPTDNLDLESILVIEETIADLEATQVAITHDATFTRVFDRFIIFDRHGVVAEAVDREHALWVASHRAFSLLDDRKMQILND